MDFKRYLVTAALPYANGPVHIGHLAGCYLPSDIYVREGRRPVSGGAYRDAAAGSGNRSRTDSVPRVFVPYR